MDRRAIFFLGAALVSALLVPVTEQAQRWVPVMLAVVYVVLAVASWADKRTRSRGRRDRPSHGVGCAGDPPAPAR
jgi:hypothetical protein